MELIGSNQKYFPRLSYIPLYSSFKLNSDLNCDWNDWQYKAEGNVLLRVDLLLLVTNISMTPLQWRLKLKVWFLADKNLCLNMAFLIPIKVDGFFLDFSCNRALLVDSNFINRCYRKSVNVFWIFSCYGLRFRWNIAPQPYKRRRKSPDSKKFLRIHPTFLKKFTWIRK